MDILANLRKLLGIQEQQPQKKVTPLPDAWDINDPSANFAPNDPRSQQAFYPSGLETNGVQSQRYAAPARQLSRNESIPGAFNPLSRPNQATFSSIPTLEELLNRYR